MCVFLIYYIIIILFHKKKNKNAKEEERMIQINVSIKKIHLANQFIFLRLNREDLV